MIRLAMPEELALVCEKITAIDPWARLQISAEQLREGLETDPSRKILVSENKGSLCGAVIYREHHGAELTFGRGFGQQIAAREGVPWPCEWSEVSDTGYIGSLAVFDGATGLGTGAALLNAVEEKIRAAGLDRVCLTVSDFNIRAQKFYYSHGYNWIGIQENFQKAGNKENLLEKRFDKVASSD